MATSSADYLPTSDSTLTDSQPFSGVLSARELLAESARQFVRWGRWRLPHWRSAVEWSRLDAPAAKAPASTLDQPLPVVSLSERHTFTTVSGWLLSMLVHSLLVILLACWMRSLPANKPLILIHAQGSEVILPFPEGMTAMTGSDRGDGIAPATFEVAIDTNLPDVQMVQIPTTTVDNALAAASNVSPFFQVEQASRQAVGRDPQGADVVGATFFGLRAEGLRFVYLVDCSRSMEGNKWESARRELLASLRKLHPSQEFYVILFDGHPHRMFDDRRPATDLLSATEANLTKTEEWIQHCQLGHNTSPCLAMKYALDLAPSAIFLLTDGEFNDPTASYLRENNRISLGAKKVPRVKVHTLGFGDRAAERLLARIAAENGGEFRRVREE